MFLIHSVSYVFNLSSLSLCLLLSLRLSLPPCYSTYAFPCFLRFSFILSLSYTFSYQSLLQSLAYSPPCLPASIWFLTFLSPVPCVSVFSASFIQFLQSLSNGFIFACYSQPLILKSSSALHRLSVTSRISLLLLISMSL